MSRFWMVVWLGGALSLVAPAAPAHQPDVEQAWKLLAAGRRAEARRLLEELVAARPNHAEARLLLGSLLSEDGNHREALPHLREAVRLRPAWAEARHALGEALSAVGDKQGARAEWERAVKMDAKFAPARVSLGLLLLEAGEFRAAESYLDQALKLLGRSPDSAFPRYLRAKIYLERGHYEEAAFELERAVAAQADFPEAWSDLGLARKMLGNDEGALAAYRRSVELDSANVVSQYRLGAEYLRWGRVREAIRHLEQAHQLDPEDQSTLYNLQLALRQDGQHERARQIRQRLQELIQRLDKLSQDAMTALRLNNEGAALERSGDLRGALEKYRDAAALDPEHAGIRTNLGAALLRLGYIEEGIAELREALRRDPHNAALEEALRAAEARAQEKLPRTEPKPR